MPLSIKQKKEIASSRIIPRPSDSVKALTPYQKLLANPRVRQGFEQHRNDKTWYERIPNTDSKVREAALKLHDLGLWIVPVQDKKPIVEWGTARLTREQLCKMLPDRTTLGIAFVLNKSEWIDIECDTLEAETALQNLFKGKVPPTPTWKSGRGMHRLFRRPPGLPTKAKIELEGIEFRIANEVNALSIVPPSVHESGMYRGWQPGRRLDDIEPAELPPEIVARLLVATTENESRVSGKIHEGERNDTLFKIARKLIGGGLSTEAVESALQTENITRCTPPLPTKEVSGIVRSARSASSQSSQKNDILMHLCEGVEFWHTPNDVAYATMSHKGYREHHRVESSVFIGWLAREFYAATGKAVGSYLLQDAMHALCGRANYDGKMHEIFIRVAEYNERIYVDLIDDNWRAIEIDKNGWRIVDNPPVRFRRVMAMQPLLVAELGGSVAELREFVNVSDEQWPLLLAWLVAALRPTGPYPVLKMLGEQGSAKTTTARVVRSLVDPNSASARSATQSERDLMISANNGWVLNFDNLSYIKPEFSDALCRLATGGGFSTRTLYKNDEETIFDAQRPIILNGIEDVGFRSDLLDRSLVLELPRIESSNRIAEKNFWQDFEAKRPRILGALLNAVSVAMRNLPTVLDSNQEWPRMADFAQWGVAAEEGLELEPGSFLSAYKENHEMASMAALESSPVVTSLLDLLERKQFFRGTAAELFTQLSICLEWRDRTGPKNPRALSALLTRVAPNLRQLGIEIERYREENRKLWEIRRTK